MGIYILKFECVLHEKGTVVSSFWVKPNKHPTFNWKICIQYIIDGISNFE